MELLLLSCSVLALILFPKAGTQGAMEGIRLCGCTLIPALFPFIFLTKMIIERIPMPKKNRSAFVMAMGFIGGYPTGVVTAVSLYQKGKLSRSEVQRLIPYCNHSGPGFFVGVLGMKIFGDPIKGLILYGIHVLTAVMVYLLCYKDRNETVQILPVKKEGKRPFSVVFQDALTQGCDTMIRICGLVILFSVIREFLILILPTALYPYMGLLELSSGLLSTGKDDFILWAVFMGWGGLCVHMQTMSILGEAGLRVKGYFPKKCLHGLLSGLCAVAITRQKWYVVVIIFLICCVFFRFRKIWGRNNRKDRL